MCGVAKMSDQNVETTHIVLVDEVVERGQRGSLCIFYLNLFNFIRIDMSCLSYCNYMIIVFSGIVIVVVVAVRLLAIFLGNF